MEFVVSDLGEELRSGRLAIVREVEEMDHVRFLFQDCLPAEIDNALQAKYLVIFLPSMANKNRVGLGQGLELELWQTKYYERLFRC